jgi:hypothetical protein
VERGGLDANGMGWAQRFARRLANRSGCARSEKIVPYLNTHLLPETYGVFGEQVGGDGNYTTVEWAYGNTVYSDFNYHSGLQAAQMAASMRVYPGGEIKP